MSVLSVLQLAPNGEYILYDEETKTAILSGTQEEIFEWKNSMEAASQMAANRIYFDQLRKERLELLIASGHSLESAENFLKQNMSYLYA